MYRPLSYIKGVFWNYNIFISDVKNNVCNEITVLSYTVLSCPVMLSPLCHVLSLSSNAYVIGSSEVDFIELDGLNTFDIIR